MLAVYNFYGFRAVKTQEFIFDPVSKSQLENGISYMLYIPLAKNHDQSRVVYFHSLKNCRDFAYKLYKDGIKYVTS